MAPVKLLEIKEGTKFFDFLEKMEKDGIESGRAKLKDGTDKNFKYITSEIKNGKKVHYITL
jgi:hypothetical protein